MRVSNKLSVGVIFGGRSGEHAVSLASARSVLASLDPEKYVVTQIGITQNGIWLTGKDVLQALSEGDSTSLENCTLLPMPTYHGLYNLKNGQTVQQLEFLIDLDVIIPVLHGTFGEDGTLQGLLDLAGLAYVGAGVTGSAVGMDKGIFKAIMTAEGIPVVPWRLFLRSELDLGLDAIVRTAETLGDYPLFTKPANLGSSVGITKCRNRSDLLEGLQEAARFDRRILVEKGINAREIEVSVLGNDQPDASTPGEIRPDADFYSYDAKYHDARSELLIPAPLSDAQVKQVKTLAVQAFKAIDCAGMARVDFLLDKENGNLYLNEINTIPGFTQISMYPKLWEASGLPYPALLDRLITLALDRKSERDRTEHIL